MNVGETIRLIRGTLGLTQDEFASALSVSRYSITNYEQGKTLPGSDFYKILIQRFDVNINFVLTGIGMMFTRMDFEDVFTILGLPRNEDTEELLTSLKIPVVRKALCAELSVITNKYRDTITAQEAEMGLKKVIQNG